MPRKVERAGAEVERNSREYARGTRVNREGTPKNSPVNEPSKRNEVRESGPGLLSYRV